VNEPLHCVNHPNMETYLRCNRCNAPICPKCAVRTEVGYRCRACINRQQRAFYADFRPVYYLVAAAVALPLGLIGGLITPALEWYTIFVGPLVGLGIAELAHRAVGRRRGRYTWLVVAGCILLGGLPQLLFSFLPLAWRISASPLFSLLSLVWPVVYLVTAVGSAVARLRPGRRP